METDYGKILNLFYKFCKIKLFIIQELKANTFLNNGL